MSATLVLGNYRATLVVIRSLAAAGQTIVLGVAGKTQGNDASRYVAECWQHPAFDAADGAFGTALRELLDRREDIRTIFPVTEEAVVHFARAQYCLPERVTLASTRPESVAICQSKQKSLALAWFGRLVWNALRADIHLIFRWRDPKPTLANFARRSRQRGSADAPKGSLAWPDAGSIDTK